jgi:hypothetical protein
MVVWHSLNWTLIFIKELQKHIVKNWLQNYSTYFMSVILFSNCTFVSLFIKIHKLRNKTLGVVAHVRPLRLRIPRSSLNIEIQEYRLISSYKFFIHNKHPKDFIHSLVFCTVFEWSSQGGRQDNLQWVRWLYVSTPGSYSLDKAQSEISYEHRFDSQRFGVTDIWNQDDLKFA